MDPAVASKGGSGPGPMTPHTRTHVTYTKRDRVATAGAGLLRVRAIPQWCVIDVSFHPGRVPDEPIEHCSSTACPEVRAACGRDRVAAAWGRLAPRACCSRRRHAQSALRGAVGACWLSSGCPSCGVQSASTRARGPASPRSPPLITALRLVRGLVRTTMSGLGVRQVAKGRSESATAGFWAARAGERREGGARRALELRLCPARSRTTRRGAARWPWWVASFHRPYTCSLRRRG